MQQTIISTPMPYRSHGLWSRVFEYHRLFLALLLGMFLGAQGIAVTYHLGWLEWAAGQLGQVKATQTDGKSPVCPVNISPKAKP